MEHRPHTIQHDTDPRATPFIQLCSKGYEERFDILPGNIRKDGIFEYRLVGLFMSAHS